MTMIKFPNNVKKIDETPGNYKDLLGGVGVGVCRVKVHEPGNGFMHAGVWDLVAWQHARGSANGWNLDDGLRHPYASAPVFVRPLDY